MAIPPSMICKCLRCGHRWVKRIAGRPKKCAHCKETNWDIAKGKLRRGRRVSNRGLLKQSKQAA